MGNMLVRGLPERIRRRLESFAESQNLSLNQTLLRLIEAGLQKEETEKEKEERRKEAFRRIRELREEIYRKYGFQEDSAKIIRELRDERAQKYG
jgi:flagellar biosynthesis component FlhA